MFGFGTGRSAVHGSWFLKLWVCFCSSQHAESFVFVVFLENDYKVRLNSFRTSSFYLTWGGGGGKKSFVLISKVHFKLKKNNKQ